jgi:hypothetical protein
LVGANNALALKKRKRAASNSLMVVKPLFCKAADTKSRLSEKAIKKGRQIALAAPLQYSFTHKA